MATDTERLRKYLAEQVVINIPRGFLDEIQRRTSAAYQDQFQQVDHDPTTVQEQRLARLIQDRFFRMEWELSQAAKAQGMPATSKPLPENSWQHTYVSTGAFGLTQSYVTAMGVLPQPAKFRDDLAQAARIPRFPIDDPKEIYELKKFYGLFAHNPIGRTFSERDQKLGSLQLCIPYHDMKGWALEISVVELLAHYPVEAKKVEPTRSPTWKRRLSRESEGA